MVTEEVLTPSPVFSAVFYAAAVDQTVPLDNRQKRPTQRF